MFSTRDGEDLPRDLLEESAGSVGDLLVGVTAKGVAGLLLEEVKT